MLRTCSCVSRASLPWRSVTKKGTELSSYHGTKLSSFVFRSQNIRYIHTTSILRNNNDQEAESKVDSVTPADQTPPPPPAPKEENTKQENIEVPKTPEQIKAERKARKEKKKKNKQAKVVIEEDEVEKRKRLRKEFNQSLTYQGDGSEIDPTSDDLNDDVISQRMQKLYDGDTPLALRQLKHKLNKQDDVRLGAMLPSFRYWDEYNVPKNPYTHIRFNQAYSKWLKRDLRTLSNEDYQNLKFNTLARMNATVPNYQIFPDVLKKFTPTINLLAEFNDPIARDILVYYGNIIPARFTENKPDIKFTGKPGNLYTLLLVDAKNPTYLKEYGQSIQWMITDIPEDGDISKGNEQVEYYGATPLEQFGPNRLVFLLFRQCAGKLDMQDFEHIKREEFLKREPFDTAEFALQHELKPRGLTFFNCPYDNTVTPRFENVGLGEPQFIRELHIQRKVERKQKRDATREGTAEKWTWFDQQKHISARLDKPQETPEKE